jgi:hypothetical protein
MAHGEMWLIRKDPSPNTGRTLFAVDMAYPTLYSRLVKWNAIVNFAADFAEARKRRK